MKWINLEQLAYGALFVVALAIGALVVRAIICGCGTIGGM